jgi:integrase
LLQNVANNLERWMPSERINLTDKFLRALKPEEKAYEIYDGLPGFGIRVSPKGAVTFFLLARYGGSKVPQRKKICRYNESDPNCSLAAARATAIKWKAALVDGKNPAAERAANKAANEARQRHTFKNVAEEYIEKYLPSKRSRKVIESDLRTRFMPDEVWGLKTITEITQDDVISEIQKIVDAGHRAQAHNSFGIIRGLFNWACARPFYGLERRSPCDKFDVRRIIGKKSRRRRVLSETELRALWRATERLGYPWGPLYRLLALTGQRMGEIGRSSWPEYDLDKRYLLIPASRMKAGIEHICPLSGAAFDIIQSLPRFEGPFLFSNNGGQKPAMSYSLAKAKLDRLMLEELRAMAVEEGKEAAAVTLTPFVIHDLRRTCRSGMSALRIAEETKERVLAHLPPGIQQTYDQHDFLPEKREALGAWARRLEAIVNPPPSNVIAIRA